MKTLTLDFTEVLVPLSVYDGMNMIDKIEGEHDKILSAFDMH